jgi:hypothetical protein
MTWTSKHHEIVVDIDVNVLIISGMSLSCRWKNVRLDVPDVLVDFLFDKWTSLFWCLVHVRRTYQSYKNLIKKVLKDVMMDEYLLFECGLFSRKIQSFSQWKNKMMRWTKTRNAKYLIHKESVIVWLLVLVI